LAKIEEIDLNKFTMGFRASETTQAQMSRQDVLEALRSSFKFFINFFIPEELTHEVPEFHENAWQYLIQVAVEYIALALPRGHAKTTLAKLAAVWYFLFTPFRFILYVSNTFAVASEACKDIVKYMQGLNFEAAFGPLDFNTEQHGKGFYKFTLMTFDETGAPRVKFCILKPLGAGQQVRGTNIDNTRPELAVVDDLEDNDNTATPLLQNKLKRWFFGDFLKALSSKFRKVIYLGNMLSNKSLLHHFCTNSDEWHSMRLGCLLSDGKPLWPEIWPLARIAKDYLEYQKLKLIGLWFAEMMNLPIADGNLLIQPEEIPYKPEMVPGEQEMAFITVDTAISQKAWGNDTALVVHAFKGQSWQIVEVVAGQFSPDQVFHLLVELCRKWRTKCVGIEQTALQMALKFLFEVMMTVHKFNFEVYEIPHKNKSKTERLAVFCSAMREGQWSLSEGDFIVTQQLLQYDPTKDNNEDDIIDSASMGITMTRIHMPAIMDSYRTAGLEYQVKSGYAICKI